MLLYAACILFGIATFVVANTMFSDEDKFKASEKLDEVDDKKDFDKEKAGIILRYSKPFFKRYVSPIVSQMKNKKSIRNKYKRKLASAGMSQILTPEDFFSFKLFLILGFPIVFLGVRAFLEESWPLTLVPVLAVFGFFYPDIWLGGLIKKRQKDIILGMPFVVDMLALSVEAGLDFMAAITKVVEKAPRGPIIEEFEILIKETRVGASRAEGLRTLAWRVDLIQISSFCATLIAADSVGASIGPILKNLSAEIRQKRSAEAEKAGATAATKILFPMMIFIIPAVFLVIMGPMAVQMFTGQ